MLAAGYGYTDIVKILLAHSANPRLAAARRHHRPRPGPLRRPRHRPLHRLPLPGGHGESAAGRRSEAPRSHRQAAGESRGRVMRTKRCGAAGTDFTTRGTERAQRLRSSVTCASVDETQHDLAEVIVVSSRDALRRIGETKTRSITGGCGRREVVAEAREERRTIAAFSSTGPRAQRRADDLLALPRSASTSISIVPVAAHRADDHDAAADREASRSRGR